MFWDYIHRPSGYESAALSIELLGSIPSPWIASLLVYQAHVIVLSGFWIWFDRKRVCELTGIESSR